MKPKISALASVLVILCLFATDLAAMERDAAFRDFDRAWGVALGNLQARRAWRRAEGLVRPARAAEGAMTRTTHGAGPP